MKTKNQVLVKKLVKDLPEGMNHYKKVKKLVEEKNFTVEKAFIAHKFALENNLY
ncbi:MAG: hypothetical protein ACEQSQ_06045 [Candidatus Paceibacteria bacterium]